MKTFHVSFYKKILSSDGHLFICLQRSFDVVGKDADRAIAAAKIKLERSGHVPTWKLRADSLEFEEKS